MLPTAKAPPRTRGACRCQSDKGDSNHARLSKLHLSAQASRTSSPRRIARRVKHIITTLCDVNSILAHPPTCLHSKFSPPKLLLVSTPWKCIHNGADTEEQASGRTSATRATRTTSISPSSTTKMTHAERRARNMVRPRSSKPPLSSRMGSLWTSAERALVSSCHGGACKHSDGSLKQKRRS